MSSKDTETQPNPNGSMSNIPQPVPIPTPIVPPDFGEDPIVVSSAPKVGLTDPDALNLYVDVSMPPSSSPSFIPDDPLYSQQWHVDLLGDIEEVWGDYTGAGVTVGVYDDGFQHSHPDLSANYDASKHFVHITGEAAYDPAPLSSGDAHGTAVGGLIGAVGDNALGVTGLGFEATLTGVNYLEDIQRFPSNRSWSNSADQNWFIDRIEKAFEWAGNFDIMNNSWGSVALYDDTYAFWDNLTIDAYQEIHETGRGNLGTLVLQAAGNDNTNAVGELTNASRFNVSIAATDDDGDAESYTSWGPGILIAAPAGAVTTDLTGNDGYSGSDYTYSFNGTSAATPVTAGVVSLILDANEDLGWRDVQNILAESASLTGSNYGAPATGYEDSSWGNTGSSNWNGGGHAFNLSYGYGLVDGYAAVRMAEVWGEFYASAYTSANEVQASGTYSGGAVAIPNSSSTDLDLTVATNIEVETAIVSVSLSHEHSGDLTLTLVSPSGAEMPLFDQELVYNYSGTQPSSGIYYDLWNGEPIYRDISWLTETEYSFFETTTSWDFEVTGLRGYDSAGTWSLRAGDVDSDGDTGSIGAFGIEFFGAPKTTDDVHTLTTDFQWMKAVDAGRGAIADSDGGTDWLNAVSIYSATNVDLRSSVAVGGVAWATLDGSIENVATGDGDDTITGTDGANKILGGRGDDIIDSLDGDDHIDAGIGDDTIKHSAGVNTYIGGEGDDTLSLASTPSSAVSWSVDGTSQLLLTDNGSSSVVSSTIDFIAFSNETLTYAAAYALGSITNSDPVFTSGMVVDFAENGTMLWGTTGNTLDVYWETLGS